MSDTRFFHPAGPFPLSKLIEHVDVNCPGESLARTFKDVAALDKAGPEDIGFLINPKYRPALATTNAGAVILSADDAAFLPAGIIGLVSPDPHRAYAKIAQKFYPDGSANGSIHTSAIVSPTAKLGQSVELAAGVVIGDQVSIGDGCRIGPNTVIGHSVQLGENTRVEANVTLSHCLIGSNCSILPGVRIGQRGFGFAMGPQGHEKVPQTGCVIVGDGCEIGANTTIDRGAGPDTVIGDGTMIDNLVQIGHNVQTGKNCVIVAQAGVAGSTKLGDFVVIAGASSVAGHLDIGSGTTVLGKSGVIRDTKPGEKLMGIPAVDSRTFFKSQAMLSRMLKKRAK